MWGTGIVGFGIYNYKYESGHGGNAPLAGLASRKNAITIYLAYDFEEKEALLSQLGKYKSGMELEIRIPATKESFSSMYAELLKLSGNIERSTRLRRLILLLLS